MEEYVTKLLSYEDLQQKVLSNEKAIDELEKSGGSGGSGGSTTSIPEMVADSGSVSDSSFKPGVLGGIRIYNKSGGLRYDDLTNGGKNYGKRLQIAAAEPSDMKFKADGTAENVSANKPIVPANMDTALSIFLPRIATTVAQSIATKGATGDFSDNMAGMAPASSYAVKQFVHSMLSTVGIKVRCLKLPIGKTCTIPPSTLALVAPYTAKFSGYDVYTKKTESITFSNIGIIMNSAPMSYNGATGEEWDNPDGEATRCFAAHISLNATSRNLMCDKTTVKIQNTDSGSSGSGATYIYYISDGEVTIDG